MDMTDSAPQPAWALRHALRQDVADRARWTALARAGQRLQQALEPAQALDALLDEALMVLGAQHGAVLGTRERRWTVLAARGQAMPPGASVPAPIDPAGVQVTGVASWLLRQAQAGLQAVEVPVPGPRGPLGRICMAARAAPPRDDLDSLAVLAALAAGWIHDPARGAPRRARRGGDPRLALLTERERQVLALLGRGLSNAALGRELGIAAGTVKTHVERILHKLEVADRTQAAVFASQHGVAA